MATSYFSARLESAGGGVATSLVASKCSDPDIEIFDDRARAMRALEDLAAEQQEQGCYIEWYYDDGELAAFNAWPLMSRENWPASVGNGELELGMFEAEGQKFIQQQFGLIKDGILHLYSQAGAAYLKAAYAREKPRYAGAWADELFVRRFVKAPGEIYTVADCSYLVYPDGSLQYPCANTVGVAIHGNAIEFFHGVRATIESMVSFRYERSQEPDLIDPWLDESDRMVLVFHHLYRYKRPAD